jgi:fatty acid kinase fatty acid binding subunit
VTVRVVIDSTADVPSERARELGITVVPLAVSFGEETYLDGVNLDGDEFYRKLAKSPVLPKTATPSPGVFDETYRKLIAEGATGILSIHIASKLSGTYSVARQAAEPIIAETGVPIEAIDSNSVSCGFGLPAEILAREAREGADLQTLKTHGESLCSRMHLIAVLDTLEFLQRGGRIGRARAILGTALKVKPLLEVRDGQVLPLEQVRTLSKALDRMAQLIAKQGELEAVAICGSDDHIRGEIKQVAQTIWNGPIEMFSLGPVVGTHAGPGAGGIAAIVRE